MNWQPISAESFRSHLDQGKGLVLRGGPIYGDTHTNGPSIGVFFIWYKKKQYYLKLESYYNGKELYSLARENQA